MSKHGYAFALAGLALLAGCARGGSGTIPAAPIASIGGDQFQSIIVHGNFTEYALPPGIHPVDFTKGASNTLWFDTNNAGLGNGFHLYRFTESTGAVSTFSKGAPWNVLTTPLTVASFIYFITLNTNGPGENPEYLSHATFAGALSTGPGVAGNTEIPSPRTVVGSDGHIWYAYCGHSCNSFESGDGIKAISTNVAVALTDFQANFIAPGPSGNLYVTASFNHFLPSPPSGHDSAVFVVSTSGTIVHKFFLPDGSGPWGIVTGSDHNLWIAEPGINKIARMTPTGTITQFVVPTANAQASWIVNGADGALWFTETHGNKIGRITTTGSFHEFTLPAANSGPNAIQNCTSNCGARGGVWFAETTANRIGRFNSPL